MTTGDGSALLRQALTLHAQGQTPEAEAIYRQLLGAEPDHPQALGMLGLLLSDGPNADEARDLLQRRLKQEPNHGPSLHALGRLAARAGQEEEALGLLQAASLYLPNLAPVHNDLGASLHRLGRLDEALMAFDRAVTTDPAYVMALANRAFTLHELHRYSDAVEGLLDALQAAPDDAAEVRVAILVQLAQAARKGGRPDVALDGLNADWRRAPERPELTSELALTLEACDRADEARAVRNEHARRAGVRRKPSALGKPRMLVLGAVGGGHTPTRYLVDDRAFEVLSLTLLSPDEADAPLGAVDPQTLEEVDVVFSTLGDIDHDGGQFAAASALIARLGKPVLNPPAAIAPTGREQAPNLFAGIEGLVVPAVTRITAEGLADMTIKAPVLSRPAGDHGGDNLIRLDDEAAKVAYLPDAPSGPLIVTRFHDFSSPDGHWRKYRLIFVDRQAFPYHLAVGDGWLAHYWRAEMGRAEWKRQEEEAFLADWRAVFGPRAAAAADAVARRIDLDYAGMDCALTSDGELLLFEANACVLLHLDEPAALFPYKHRYVPPIRDAFTQLALRRAGQT